MRLAALVLLTSTVLVSSVGRADPPPAGAAPGTQVEVPRVSNFQTLAGLLNLARGAVRIVAIISPSTPDDEAGAAAMLQIVHDNPSKRLRAYVIMTAAADDDTQFRALDFAGRHAEDRVVFFWDPTAVVANAWLASVGQESGPVHAAYFLYDTATAFGTMPPAPDLSMNNHPGWKGPELDVGGFRARVDELVRRVESKAADAARDGE